PLACAAPPAITEGPRYAAVAELGARLADENLVNGMHVHVGVPDRDTGVAVLNRIRRWLPALVAMGGNSPLWWGRDTGYASWRTVVFGRWPVGGPPPRFDGRADYERRVGSLLAARAILDSGQLYWQARLSERYPTVEVRCLDVQLTVDDATLFAGLVRGLVATAVLDDRSGRPEPEIAPELLHAATWHAARYGLRGELLDTEGGRHRPAADIVRALLDHVAPGLAETGDVEEVTRLLQDFLRRGAPAERQRRALRAGGLEAWTDLVSAVD
ncbi:YbdK family carboxylate-amine ligase, partial [Streptomyces sp. UNOC14_S4]|uniref:carboxylate-amine ligase n=1 Tax=Streptomyces sp. UNOC14_S4 TaxID=2872340 RepID=UPI001E3D3C82